MITQKSWFKKNIDKMEKKEERKKIGEKKIRMGKKSKNWKKN